MDIKDSRAIAKFLDFIGGALLIATIQADVVVYFQAGALPTRVIVASVVVATLGAVILFCGLFWHRITPQGESVFVRKLAEWSSSPGI